ncbi:MAG: glycosyltransferase [Hymenobacter sp.]|nr:MAG: glycosyltransferase [Hymenobacter sp.]
MAALILPEVTLLVTHYNRSASLRRLLLAFQGLGCQFGATVVSDDCSQPVHQQALRDMQEELGFQLVNTPQNRGLGHNLNKGQDAVRTPYTLYVQEDFVPTPRLLVPLQQALAVLQAQPEVDLMRFYAYYAYPYLRPCGQGFAEMLYKPWFMHTGKIYQYSDHPHLRRSTFLQKFGRYAEGIKSDKAEYLMCLSFIQRQGKALFYRDFSSLFQQENSAAEPSTVQRSNWRQSGNPLVALVRGVYRQLKYNYDLHLRSPA